MGYANIRTWPWSIAVQIPDRSEGWFLAIFTRKIVGGMTAIVWVRPWASTTSVLELMAAAVVVSAATTAIITQGGTMLAERYLRRRFQEGREQERRQLARRMAELTPKERLKEINRLIAEAQGIVDKYASSAQAEQ